MARSDTIQFYRGSGAPSDLYVGEPAWDHLHYNFYLGNSLNAPILVCGPSKGHVVRTTTSDLSLTAYDEIIHIDGNTATSDITINLPSTLEGKWFKIVNVSTSDIDVLITPSDYNIFGSDVWRMNRAEIADIHLGYTYGWF